jgi:hypothetical protein
MLRMCVYMHSRFVENHLIRILEDGPFIFKAVLSQLLIKVIFQLKCNNLIFNEIMVLNASYVCLHAFSLRRESPDPDPGRRTPHF